MRFRRLVGRRCHCIFDNVHFTSLFFPEISKTVTIDISLNEKSLANQYFYKMFWGSFADARRYFKQSEIVLYRQTPELPPTMQPGHEKVQAGPSVPPVEKDDMDRSHQSQPPSSEEVQPAPA